MADYTVAVSANALVPAVLYLGTEGSAGHTVTFNFSDDWDGMTKEVFFYDMRGNVIVSPLVDGQSIPVPDEIAMYGGPHKFTVRGFTLDENLYIDEQLQVTGTLVTTYTAGHNPRMEGKLIPSTLDLFLYQANQAMLNDLAQAKASGEFNGRDGAPGAPGVNGHDGTDGVSCGFGEVSATAETLGPNDQATVSVSTTGPDDAKNFSFSFGIPQGQPATNVSSRIQILGHYASLQDLQAAVPDPEPGDPYSVGSYTPYNLYIFDGPTQAWANYGPISASQGSSVIVDSSIIENSTNPVQSKVIQTYVASLIPTIPTALKNPNALTIFGTAYDGSSAVTVTMDSEMSDSSTNAVQNCVIKAYIDGLIGDINAAIGAIQAVIGGGET